MGGPARGCRQALAQTQYSGLGRRGLGVLQLKRGEQIETPDGGFITVEGNDVVKQYPDGRTYIANVSVP